MLGYLRTEHRWQQQTFSTTAIPRKTALKVP
jgi:hypothetical protein